MNEMAILSFKPPAHSDAARKFTNTTPPFGGWEEAGMGGKQGIGGHLETRTDLIRL